VVETAVGALEMTTINMNKLLIPISIALNIAVGFEFLILAGAHTEQLISVYDGILGLLLLTIGIARMIIFLK